jgi:diaminopimelate decarboxylase
MQPALGRNLLDVARSVGTPVFVYDLAQIRERHAALVAALGGRLEPSFAVKCNPNVAMLARLRGTFTHLDVSASGELDRAVRAGYDPAQISFSGPAKRPFELERAVGLGVGEIVCESLREVRALGAIGRRVGRDVPVLLRINPLKMPAKFGLNMAGRASQFGIDEEEMDAVLPDVQRAGGVDLRGFHIFSGTNALDASAIGENFAIFAELFTRFSERYGIRPQRLIFGSGMGVPFLEDHQPLDLADVAAHVNPVIDALLARPSMHRAKLLLEMGRWLVGPCGWLLAGVVGEKRSRGVELRLLDAGFNNHLAAAGMMGTVIRRNWVIEKLGEPAEPTERYTLTGPLCTTIDALATKIALPPLAVGDVVAVACSGAYGLSASPTGFISHPEPREILLDGEERIDATESERNAPPDGSHRP